MREKAKHVSVDCKVIGVLQNGKIRGVFGNSPFLI
jgi:hypothetical protein